MSQLELKYLDKLEKVRSYCIDDLLDRYPLLTPIKNYALLKEEQLKQSNEYKEAQLFAEKIGFSYNQNSFKDIKEIAILHTNPILEKLFEIEAFPNEFIEEIVIDCCIQGQYWHITELPDDVNDMLPIDIIYTDDNSLQNFSSIGDAYLKGFPFTSTVTTARKFEIYTDDEKFHYDLDDLPLHVKNIVGSIRQITKEWYRIALPLLEKIKDPGDAKNVAWDAAPIDLKSKYIATIRQIAREVWEFHNKQSRSKRRNKPIGTKLPPLQTDFIETDSTGLFHAFRSSLSLKSSYCNTTENRWPTADITNGKQTIKAIAQLKPHPLEIEPKLLNDELIMWENRMADLVMSMGDLTADVLDIISAAWLSKAEHHESTIDVTADDFLQYRGLKPQKSGNGRRGGFKNEVRQEIARQITVLDNTWLTVFEMDITDENHKRSKWQGESKAIVVSSRARQVKLDGTVEDAFAWRVRPGDCFTKFLLGPGRQTALLSQKALHYDYIKQKWEKRLTRYLSWLWRITYRKGFADPITVATLITKGVMEKIDSRNPARTKERLEKALDQLQADEIILSWQYEIADEGITGKRGWINEWLQWKILIEPPQIINDQYLKITQPNKHKNKQILKSTVSITGEMVKEKRILMGLTQTQLAEEVNISRSRISLIENDTKITKPELKKLNAWLYN